MADSGVLGLEEDISSLLSIFSQANHIYLREYEPSGRPASPFPRSGDEEAVLGGLVTPEMQRLLVASFSDGGIEDCIEGETNSDFVRMKGLSLRDSSGRLLRIFSIIGIIEEAITDLDTVPACLRRTDGASFDSSVLLLRDFLHVYTNQHTENIDLSNRLRETEETGDRLEGQLKRNEVMTEILKMLESEGDFVKVADDILRVAGAYIGVSNAFLLRLSPDGLTSDMICEWHKEGARPLIRDFQSREISDLPFMTERPYTVSSDSVMPKAFRDFFDSYDMKAGIFLPVRINGTVGMYLGFSVAGEERHWGVEELRFCDDVRRVLSTVLVKRVTKNSLASSYAALDAILENTGSGISVYDPQKKVFLYSNGKFQQMFADAADRTAVEEVLAVPRESGTTIAEYYAEDSARFYTISFAAIRWVDGREVSMATFSDITDLKTYQKTIEDQANTDFLTGLSNRLKFETDIADEIRSAVRSGDNGTLLYVDLDDFRAINDGLGHHVGDALLKEAAEALKVICGSRARAYRLGGDEFAVIIPAKHHDISEKMIELISRRFGQPWSLDSSEYYCTMCMGVVDFPRDGTRSELLMQRADLSLRIAKGRGKGIIEYYSASQPESLTKRLDIERAMRGAVDRGCSEFLVYYQPLIDVTKPERPCCGAEALVRWKSSELGFVYPSEFIPVAESLGLIVQIGEHVLIEACKRCKYWNDFGHPEYKIHVNLSIVQLLQKDIVQTIRNAIDFTGITPANLTLEVTESLAAKDMEKMVQVLKDIKALGVRLALDDFGTGYSSLSRLKDMPMDVIKIDKSFVDNVGQDVFSNAFVKTVADLADSIDMDVVVEGVEAEKQEEALETMNVNIIQGYLFDKPLTQEDFEAKYVD